MEEKAVDRLPIAQKENCVYCERSWPFWDGVLRGIPPHVDPVVFALDGNMPHAARRGPAGMRIFKTVSEPQELWQYASATPTVLLFSRNGTLLHRWTGELSSDSAREFAASLRTME